MSEIIDRALHEIQRCGYMTKVVSVVHLAELQEAINRLHCEGLLDKRMSDEYLRFQYCVPENLPDATAILVTAIPQPVTRVQFIWRGINYSADIPPTYIGTVDDSQIKEIFTSILEPAGYKLERARLPLKTLAVRSGLMQYGRNNITYTLQMGSFQRLVAFYSNCPIDRDDWQELKVMKACKNCFKCLENCPTRCISADRFLIHAEKCLTWLNENENNFPDWVKPDWHNALIGCLRCQSICPMNKRRINKVADGPKFSESETGLLLRKIPFDKLPEVTRKKLIIISANEWYEVLARNLGVLIESKGFTTISGEGYA